jgi:hypothetical protein
MIILFRHWNALVRMIGQLAVAVSPRIAEVVAAAASSINMPRQLSPVRFRKHFRYSPREKLDHGRYEHFERNYFEVRVKRCEQLC